MCDGQLLHNGHWEAKAEREAKAGGKTKEKLKKGGDAGSESRKVDKEGEVEINKM